ncbi:MAG: 2-dehydropantoate 2-reductase [Bdellovibrionota bacterium]
MKIAVIGTGGVGGYFGGKLARAGHDVTFVARGAHYDALASRGLTVKAVDGDFQVHPLRVVDRIGKLDRPDLVLVATKTYDRDVAGAQLREVVSPSTTVIPLLNGIDNDLRLQALLPGTRVYAGLAYVISARTEPGVIVQSAGPRTLVFGERKNPENRALQAIASMMREAGIDATAAADIEEQLWIKFLWIVTFAGMTSVCRSSIGAIVNDPESYALLVRCCDEAIAVGRAEGVSIGDVARAQILDKAEKYRTVGSDAKASMLVDIEHGRQTEIDSLNGAIVRLARSHGLSVPIHETITCAVKLATAAFRSSSAEH